MAFIFRSRKARPQFVGSADPREYTIMFTRDRLSIVDLRTYKSPTVSNFARIARPDFKLDDDIQPMPPKTDVVAFFGAGRALFTNY